MTTSSFIEDTVEQAALDWLQDLGYAPVHDPDIAPEVTAASKPNDRRKDMNANRQQKEADLTDLQQLRLEYWQALVDYLKMQGSFVWPRSAHPRRELVLRSGSGGYVFYALADLSKGDRIGAQFVIDKGKEYFAALLKQKSAIEAETGLPLEWQDIPNKKRCTVSIYDYNFDPTDRNQWTTQQAWFQQTLEALHKAFVPRVKNLRLDN